MMLRLSAKMFTGEIKISPIKTLKRSATSGSIRSFLLVCKAKLQWLMCYTFLYRSWKPYALKLNDNVIKE